MIEIKIMTMATCAILFAIGGACWHNARRFIMPVVITAACLWITRSWWAATQLTAIGPLCLGYGDKSIFRHIFGDAWGRGVWGILVALALSLGLFLTGHLGAWWFAGYLVVGFFAEPLFKNLPQVIGDLIIGAAFGSIVFIVHV